MKFTKLVVVAAMTAVGSASSAFAQATLNCGGAGEAVLAASPSVTCRLTNTVSATVPTVARLFATSTTTTLTAPMAVNFGDPAGVPSVGPTINVKSNTGYTLTTSSAANWTSPAGTTKLATDLKMNVNGGSNVALGQVAPPTTGPTSNSGNDYIIGYNTLYNFATDIPGVYSLIVNYTLTAP